MKNKLNWSVYFGVFFVSMVILSLEVIVNRLFSLTYWYHFAFLIISVALFGIGIGGLAVFFINRFLKNFKGITLAVLAIGLAFVIPLALIKINTIPLEMEKIATSPEHQKLFIHLFLLLTSPFFLSGIIFSFAFTNFKDEINKIYLFDLVGGGIGCFLMLLVFPGNGPFVTAFYLSCIAIAAAFFFAWNRIKYFALLIPIIFLSLAIYFVYPQVKNVEPRLSQAKHMPYTEGKKKIYARWDNFGYTAVHERTSDSIEVTANYSTFTHMFYAEGIKNFRNYKGSALVPDQFYPFIIKKNPENVAIVGVGSGRDIVVAYWFGAKNVWGAEYNPTIYDVFMNRYREYNGNLGHIDNVHIYNDEGRFFLRSSRRLYDVIMFDNAIALAAVQSGAFTLAEGYLYTVEAFMDYMNKLKPGGILYLSNPYVDHLRFVTIAREAFRRLGREKEFKDSVIVINNEDKTYTRCKVILKNGAFTQKEIDSVYNFGNSLAVPSNIIYAPYNAYRGIVSKLVSTDDVEKEYRDSRLDIRPSTDDWPFYSQTVKLKDALKIKNKMMGDLYSSAPFIMIIQIAKYVLLFSLVFLILPLILFNFKGFRELDNKISSVFYFAALGLGFMLTEIVLMQKYMLVLGHPIYSFSVILSSLMISSGIGSMVSEYFKNPYKAIITGLGGILMSLFIIFLFSRYATGEVINYGFIWRVMIIALLTAISGFFMGFMMPSGIRAVSKVESSIPWLWSINGVFSVLAGFVSIYTSILYGFNDVLMLAGLIYVLGTAIFCFRFLIGKSKAI